MPLENSLNEKNKELYDKLKAVGAEIDFKVEENYDSWVMLTKRSYSIGAPNNDVHYPGMAHELLHIQLDLKGFWSSHHIYKFFHYEDSYFNFEFINALSNDLAHFKMLDDFIAMGYYIDEFLQKTPKQYFVEGTYMKTISLVLGIKTGRKICEDILNIVKLVAEAKLFELYKIKDPSTVNGVHADLVLDPLREIDKELVDGLVQIFADWNEANTVDNLQFYYRLDIFLKERNILPPSKCNSPV